MTDENFGVPPLTAAERAVIIDPLSSDEERQAAYDAAMARVS